MCGEGPKDPGDRTAQDNKAPDSFACVPQFAEVEAQAAFEEDKGNADRHHRIEQFAEGMFGIEEPEYRTRQKSSGQHEDDCWPPGTPGKPLGTYAQHAHHRDD